MKSGLVLMSVLILMFSVSCYAQKQEEVKTDSVVWLNTIEEAINQGDNVRGILVNFTGSDWCGWCTKLREEVFSQDEFIQYAKENLNLVMLNYPKYIQQSQETINYNRAKLGEFNIRGFPTILILDASGKEITKTGYVPGGAQNYVNHLENILIRSGN